MTQLKICRPNSKEPLPLRLTATTKVESQATLKNEYANWKYSKRK